MKQTVFELAVARGWLGELSRCTATVAGCAPGSMQPAHMPRFTPPENELQNNIKEDVDYLQLQPLP